MDAFRIEEQTTLPLGKVMGLVISGIQFRLFRASITVLIVALAIAFLMTISGDAILSREAYRHVQKDTAPRRLFQFWVHRLSSPMAERPLDDTLAAMRPGDDRWLELAAWAGAGAPEMRAASENAKRELRYLDFLSSLSEGHLRVLAGPVRGAAIFDKLEADAAREKFLAALVQIGRVMPGSREDFISFLNDWRASGPLRSRALAGHRQAVETIRGELGGRGVPEMLAQLTEKDYAAIARAGFHMNGEESRRLQTFASSERQAGRLQALVQNPAFKQRLMTRTGTADLKQVDAKLLFGEAATRDGAAWVVDTAAALQSPLGMDAAAVRATASEQVRQQRLVESEAVLAPLSSVEGWLGLSRQMTWLILVSLLVCVVGIANAMLMSVAERFREIATMKCLGATDGFIMTSFILESGVQGLAGGVIGATAGLLLGSLRTLMSAGLLALRSPPAGPLLAAFGACVGLGIVLSVIAAVYPAWAAARLAPMEAMRVE